MTRCRCRSPAFAGLGLPTIAPDFAGLGTTGTQDYENNHAQGWQLLDGARAVRALLAAGVTSQDFMLSGYSQGGGAVLSAQALLANDPPGAGTLIGTVAYAPEWPISLSSFDYLGLLDNPTELTITAGLSYSSVMVLRQYAWFENHVGIGTGSQSVPTQFQNTIDGAVTGNCLVAFGAYVQVNMLHASDLINPTLSSGLQACIAAQGPADGCTGNALAYYNFLIANQITSVPNEGPVLIVQGSLDQIMPPADNASCIMNKLTSSGVNASACVFASASHTDIMNQHATGVSWAMAMLAGSAAPACPETTTLPTCD
jgi:predicted esterase